MIEKIKTIKFETPFPMKLIPEDIIIFDVETEARGDITVLGYYKWGNNKIEQLIFPDPISPKLLKDIAFFKSTFKGNSKLAIYFVKHEINLFGLNEENCIELMPIKYHSKERYIQIESLSKQSSKFLNCWETHKTEIIFHNYSCVIKEILLYLGKDNFTRPDLYEIFRRQLKNHVKD